MQHQMKVIFFWWKYICIGEREIRITQQRVEYVFLRPNAYDTANTISLPSFLLVVGKWKSFN